MSITVRELVNLPSQTVQNIKQLRLERKYASKISNSWKSHKVSREKLELNEREKNVLKKSVKKWSRRLSDSCLDELEKSARLDLDKIRRQADNPVSVNESKILRHGKRSNFLPTKPSPRASKLAAESYKVMIKNFEVGDACIVEQCYILLGTKPENSSLLISALQNLVDFEEAVSVLDIYFLREFLTYYLIVLLFS